MMKNYILIKKNHGKVIESCATLFVDDDAMAAIIFSRLGLDAWPSGLESSWDFTFLYLESRLCSSFKYCQKFAQNCHNFLFFFLLWPPVCILILHWIFQLREAWSKTYIIWLGFTYQIRGISIQHCNPPVQPMPSKYWVMWADVHLRFIKKWILLRSFIFMKLMHITCVNSFHNFIIRNEYSIWMKWDGQNFCS